MKSIKRIWNSFKIAFSMYSRIPMPRSEWTDENKSYAMCFFPWIGAVIGLLSYGVFRFSKWFDGNGGGNYSLFFVIFLIPDPGIYYGRNSSGRISGYTGCADSWQTKERRLEILKEFPRRSICYHFMYHLFSDVYWRVFLSECTEYGSDRI